MWKHVLHVCIIFLTVILYQSNAIEDFDSDSLPIDDDLWEKTNSGKPWLSNGRTRPQPVAKLEFEKPFRRLSEYYSSPNNNKWERNNKQGFNHFNKKPPMSINRKNNYESFSKANDDSFGPSFSSSGQRRPFALPSSSKSKNSFSSNLFDSQASFEKDNFFSNSPQDFMPEGDPQLVLDDNWYITRDVDYMSEGMKEVCRNLTKMCPAEFWQDQSQSSEMQPIKVPSKKIPSSYVSTNIRTRSMNTKNDFIRSVFSSSLDSAKNKIGKQLEIIDEIFLALNNNVVIIFF